MTAKDLTDNTLLGEAGRISRETLCNVPERDDTVILAEFFIRYRQEMSGRVAKLELDVREIKNAIAELRRDVNIDKVLFRPSEAGDGGVAEPRGGRTEKVPPAEGDENA